MTIGEIEATLKPCPRCGGTNLRLDETGAVTVWDYRYGMDWCVRCLDCGKRTDGYKYHTSAAEAWEKMTDED